MKKALIGGIATATLATTASAGGIDRTPFTTSLLFEDGNRVEFSIGRVVPDVSGTQVEILGGALPGSVGADSGDVANDYTTYALGFKTQVNDRVALAFIIDQPIGASVAYNDPAYAYGGPVQSTADVDSTAATALAQYQITDAISVHGGVRALQSKGSVALFNGYAMDTSRETDFGYLIGAAYEIPEYALRVALTYQSAITHDFASTEFIPPSLGGPATLGGNFEVEVPQSVLLEAQSGVAPDTLVFGSVRWTDWTAFQITPPNLGSTLVAYESDVWTFTAGVGRRFTDNWSGAVTASYEPSTQEFTSNLGPTDGQTSLGVAATYEMDSGLEVTGAARYVWVGDADTSVPGTGGTGPALGEFRDNNAFGVGVRVAYSF